MQIKIVQEINWNFLFFKFQYSKIIWKSELKQLMKEQQISEVEQEMLLPYLGYLTIAGEEVGFPKLKVWKK